MTGVQTCALPIYRWLANALATWRENDATWLEAYLAAPTWRFVLGAKMPFNQSPGYAGVLMPSVDRVGRYFPLTIVRPRGASESGIPAGWLRGLEGLAVAALHDDWGAEQLDAQLAALDEVAETDSSWPAKGRAMWWCERDGAATEPLITTGLPDTAVLVRLLAGRL